MLYVDTHDSTTSTAAVVMFYSESIPIQDASLLIGVPPNYNGYWYVNAYIYYNPKLP